MDCHTGTRRDPRPETVVLGRERPSRQRKTRASPPGRARVSGTKLRRPGRCRQGSRGAGRGDRRRQRVPRTPPQTPRPANSRSPGPVRRNGGRRTTGARGTKVMRGDKLAERATSGRRCGRDGPTRLRPSRPVGPSTGGIRAAEARFWRRSCIHQRRLAGRAPRSNHTQGRFNHSGAERVCTAGAHTGHRRMDIQGISRADQRRRRARPRDAVNRQRAAMRSMNARSSGVRLAAPWVRSFSMIRSTSARLISCSSSRRIASQREVSMRSSAA